ncbi:TetR/AcrR family transcriptional regulator [Chelativorans xinjiangense]|uniref:TetR/AcrR family transcriptional regulator n=1 Tax=Chelativorans xinjiangense TaxID=2681485 RepID=UPI00135AA9DA|nr:TetR/AcrR family transcriptional regulator [Chelativorans xinjiangense]
MPKLWNDTIESHRRAVHEAITDTAATLVAERGLRAVTMSEIAEKAGIGRATLYKYFPDVETILRAWHARRVLGHLERLAEARDRPGSAGERLTAVLEAFAFIVHETHQRQGHHDSELVAFLHRDEKVAQARRQVRDMIAELVKEGAAAGELRTDVPPAELAAYCLQALTAAGGLPSNAAVHRLVVVTLSGLRSTG